jgi:hypothetical protein
MKKILNSNFFLIAFAIIITSYLVTFISVDFVANDKVYKKFLDEKYEAKYNEYKELDVDLAEFKNELKQFETPVDDSSYGWDYFYLDSISVLFPLFLVLFSFSITFLTLILFHKKLYSIKFVHILKASLLGYIIFEIPRIISAIYFLVFKKEYEFKDIREFESYFYVNKLFKKTEIDPWIWKIISETSFVYFLFPLLVALLLHYNYRNFKLNLLIGYSYFTYLIIFIFYHTVFWYLYDLI